MKKFFDALSNKISGFFDYISDFIVQHHRCFVVWIISIFVAGAIFLNQEVKHTSDKLNLHKQYLILDAEHQLLGKDFMGAAEMIGKQRDSLQDASEYIQGLQQMLMQQDKALKQLMEALDFT